ncbi:carboxypeptidase-like regulatory domain-containing protein [Archangium gephyra]|nr:carboxypeptidase-like regulatory domain-containing protein [Archangium gephyra]
MNPDAGSGDGGTPPTSLSVSGTLVDTQGNPVPNASVLVLGSKTPTVTNSSGAFSLTGVKAPYDIAILANGSRIATVYKGLSRQDITLTLLGTLALTPRTGTLEGSLSGGETTTADHIVLFASPEVRAVPSKLFITITSSGPTYSAQVQWAGPAVTTGTLYSLQPVRTTPTAIPSRYTGFGRRENVSLGDGATASGQDILMSSVTHSTFSGTITLPSGYTLESKELSLALPPDSQVRLFSDSSSGTTFSYAVPVIPQARLSLVLKALREGASSSVVKAGLAPDTSSVTLSLPEAPRPLSPADQTTNVTRTTPLSWTAYSEAVFLLGVDKSNPTGTPYRIYIVTSEQSATIPDLSALGMSLQGNTAFSWGVTALAPLASTDDAVTGPRVSELLRHRIDGAISSSAWRDFTTAASP